MARLLPVIAAGLLSAALAAATPARAEDATASAPNAGPAVAAPSVILQLLNRQTESADMTLKESLRPDAAPAPASRADTLERMPDGSVRYGKTRVNVKVTTDCPDDPFHEAAPPPLPRRTR
jgi:hypothetical protein